MSTAPRMWESLPSGFGPQIPLTDGTEQLFNPQNFTLLFPKELWLFQGQSEQI